MMTEDYAFTVKDRHNDEYGVCIDIDHNLIITIDSEHYFEVGSQGHLNLMTGFEKITTILRESMYRYNAEQLRCRDAIVERKEE
jgi:hypothetical protein